VHVRTERISLVLDAIAPWTGGERFRNLETDGLRDSETTKPLGISYKRCTSQPAS
jgi:hypothetical protein